MNFGHSGYDGKSYKDHSCLMGNPSYGDDGPEVCWNGAKSWESGWYASDSMTVDPTVGVASLDLVGVADWVENVYTSGQHKVVLKIQDTSEPESFYVIYNRAKGPNQGVTFAKDEVTVTMTIPGKTSWHQAALGTPNATANHFPLFRKSNYDGGTKDLVIKVCDLTTGIEGTTPDTASVLIYLDDGPGLNNGEMCPGEVGCISDSQCDDGNWCTSNTCDLETNTCNALIDISATQCPTCGEQTFCNPAGYCDLVCNDQKKCTNDSCVLDQCQHDPIPGCAVHGGLLETWFSIDGNSVSDLTSSYGFQNKSADEVTIIEGSLKTQEGRGSNYGDRLRTYIYPNATGTYNFYVASDDHSELWLSTDEDPANAVKIAWVNGYTGAEVWDKFTTQKSDDISLTAGNVYYLETLHKEGGGGDHLAVGWQSVDASVPLSVINGSELFFVEPPVPCTLDSHCAALVTKPCEAGYCNVETTFCEFVPIDSCVNGAKLETWTGFTGSSLDDLTSDPRFPESPDESTILNTTLEAPSNSGDNYGRRLQTYIMPPATGEYYFYIASDDQSRLSLSSDADPANAVVIASVNGYTAAQDWFKDPSQKSDPIHLETGQFYYLEALHRDGGSSDNLAIAWEGLPPQYMALEIIDASMSAVEFVQATPRPSASPTNAPTSSSNNPTIAPSSSPSHMPSQSPTSAPSKQPSLSPINPTSQPSASPSKPPSSSPINPTNLPTSSPTLPSGPPAECVTCLFTSRTPCNSCGGGGYCKWSQRNGVCGVRNK